MNKAVFERVLRTPEGFNYFLIYIKYNNTFKNERLRIVLLNRNLQENEVKNKVNSISEVQKLSEELHFRRSEFLPNLPSEISINDINKFINSYL